MSTILNNHVNYTRLETYLNARNVSVTNLVAVPKQVVLDTTGSAHNLVPLMDVAKINYKNRFIKMGSNH